MVTQRPTTKRVSTGALRWRRSDLPIAAVVAGEPLRVAGGAGELQGLRIPLALLTVVVREVHEVAADRRAPADLLARDRLLPRRDALDEIGDVVLAHVEPGLRVLEVSALGLLHFGGVGGAFFLLLVADERRNR